MKGLITALKGVKEVETGAGPAKDPAPEEGDPMSEDEDGKFYLSKQDIGHHLQMDF
jgi:hypothetical protein